MPVSKKEFTKQLAIKMNATEKETAQWIDVFKTGEGVTITGLGSFHVSYGHGSSMKFKFNPSQQIRKLMVQSTRDKREVKCKLILYMSKILFQFQYGAIVSKYELTNTKIR